MDSFFVISRNQPEEETGAGEQPVSHRADAYTEKGVGQLLTNSFDGACGSRRSDTLCPVGA